jgi:hypothetical protein
VSAASHASRCIRAISPAPISAVSSCRTASPASLPGNFRCLPGTSPARVAADTHRSAAWSVSPAPLEAAITNVSSPPRIPPWTRPSSPALPGWRVNGRGHAQVLPGTVTAQMAWSGPVVVAGGTRAPARRSAGIVVADFRWCGFRTGGEELECGSNRAGAGAARRRHRSPYARAASLACTAGRHGPSPRTARGRGGAGWSSWRSPQPREESPLPEHHLTCINTPSDPDRRNCQAVPSAAQDDQGN